MKKSLIDKTKQLTDVATKKKFLKWLRENHVPYVLEVTGNFRLGAAYCHISDNYLCCSLGPLSSLTSNFIKCSIFIGDCFTAYNRFVFINNRYCDISHEPYSKMLREVELPKILQEANERYEKKIA